MRAQRTIARSVTVSGTGIHTGAPAVVRLFAAPVNSGITFRRVDVPGAEAIPARLDEVVGTARGLILGRAVHIVTVEHLLSAARGLRIDNLLVEVDGEELPCGDGSAQIFVDALRDAGAVDQGAPLDPICLDAPVWASAPARMIAAFPSSQFGVTCVATADGTGLEPQIAEFFEDRDDYDHAIAPARTWGMASELASLRARGQARGASLATVLAIGPEGYINAPRFANELARHKVLDVIGDLMLLGRPLRAHVVAVRAGHDLHIALAREIAKKMRDARGAGAKGRRHETTVRDQGAGSH